MIFNPATDRSRILITCAPCTADTLEKEIQLLGYSVTAKSDLFISLEGTFEDCIKLNLYLRTAYRILFLIKNFDARDFDALYKEVNKLPWENWIPADGYLSVDSRTSLREDVRDTRFPNLKVKDAIVDRILDKCGKRPDSGPDLTGCSVFLYWKQNDASIYLDTSGEPLYRRGYRTHINEAPLQETLASNIILNTRWDRKSHFINPMCGSGTLAIEAALIAINRAAGTHGRNFAFTHYTFYNTETGEKFADEAERAEKKSLPFRIIATDIDPEAIRAARRNAANAGVEHLIEFDTCDFRETELPGDNKGVVVLNPEYGMRLGEEEKLRETYVAIGDFFKQKCKGYFGYVFTGNIELGKGVGLKPKRKIPFFNAKIECRLFEFELYDGSKRLPKTEA